jgi:iron complex outermembrane receptor protein
VPGGNADLLPEDGIQLYAEAGLSGEVHKNALSFSLRYSSAFIQNWIEWVPAGSYYEPRNLKEVQTQSVKALAKGSRITGMGDWSLQLSYQYTHAVVPVSAIYLPYAPAHEAGSQLGWRYKNWTASASYRFTGQCYSDLSNNSHNVMSAYSLLDLSAGRNFYWRQSALLLTVSIDNVANTSYQVVRAYALPGRVVGLSAKWNYNIKKQIK